MSLVSIKRRALEGSLEVEHLLKEARNPSEALARVLDELSVELQWSFSGVLDDGKMCVPLAMWAKVLSVFCREGCDGLIRLASEPGHASFVIGLLEELITKEALDTLLLAFRECLSDPSRDSALSFRIASALNIMLCFKPAVIAEPSQTVELQAFLHKLYCRAESDAQRAIALSALRGVGDKACAEFAASICLSYPWHEVPTKVARHIRKRLRSAGSVNS